MGIGRKKGPGGGDGTGGTLTVTAPAGVTASVSKDGKIKTKIVSSDGIAVFKGLKSGTWTLTITDGVQTSTKPVVITADYNAVIAFFAATISVTYPAGSVCTCTDGVTTLTAPDTSGSWECIVPNAGNWSIHCSDGVESDTESVNITTDGQNVSVALAYWNGEMYVSGNEYESITGGWNISSPGQKNDSFIRIGSDIQVQQYTATATHNTPVDLTEYSTLTINFIIAASDTSTGTIKIEIVNETGAIVSTKTIISNANTTLNNFMSDIDITTLIGKYFIKIIAGHRGAGSARAVYADFDKVVLK